MPDHPSKIYCDLNARMTERGYSLERKGSIEDFAKAGLTLTSAVGMRFTFYMDDEALDGVPNDIMFNGLVVHDTDHGYLAVRDEGDFYHNPQRSDL